MQENDFDILIVGAGLGGLLSAALLSKEGYKVCVLEKNKQIGGCLQSFGFDKKLFESAVHYMGSLDSGQSLNKIFDYVGLMDKLQLTRLDLDCFDKIIIQDEEFALAQGYDRFVDTLCLKFPNQQHDIQAYVDEVRNTCQHFPLYNMRLGNVTEKNKVNYYGIKEKFDHITSNHQLQQVLSGNNLLSAGHFEYTPFYIHALIQNSYIESSWKCKDGSTQIAKLLKDIICMNGGVVIRNSHVICLKEQNGLLQYAMDDLGRRFFAKHFISNMHPQMTFRLVDSNLIRPITIKRLDALKNTLSSFMVNISLKEKMIPFVNHNVYYHTTNNVWKDAHEEILHSPTSFGIFYLEDKLNPGFASGISILTYLQAKALEPWEKTFHTTSSETSRDEKYQQFKQTYIDSIIDSIHAYIPQLKPAISDTDACTPLTYRDYLNTPQGAMYGIQKDVRNLAESTLSTRTKIPNLYLSGQNINMHGVLGVSITSVLNAADFVGLDYLLEKINKD